MNLSLLLLDQKKWYALHWMLHVQCTPEPEGLFVFYFLKGINAEKSQSVSSFLTA